MSFRTVKAFRVKELSLFSSKLKDGASASGNPVQLPNPFLPHKNPLTGRWAPAKYSLRQQADLVKSAKASGLIHLLPFGPKFPNANIIQPKPVSTEWWQARVVWEDSKPPVPKEEEKGPSVEDGPPRVTPRIRVKQMEGLTALKMYAGRKRMFKGHKWERTHAQRKKRTQILMRDMNKRITRYKEVHANLFLLRARRETHGTSSPVVPPSQAQSTQATKGRKSPQATVLNPTYSVIRSTDAVHLWALAFCTPVNNDKIYIPRQKKCI